MAPVAAHSGGSTMASTQPTPTAEKTTMTKKQKPKQQYPAGWDEKRVREVLEYYENQTDEEHLVPTCGGM